MKKIIFISGIASANLMLLGSIFKIMHWPGANILLTLAIAIFGLWFLPKALINSYKNQEVKKYKSLYIISFIVFFVVILGALFKIMHWPGAGIFLMVGIPLPFVLFLPVYIYSTRNDKKDSMINFLGIMFGLTFLAVFSVLLALNVSKNFLNFVAFNVESNENIIEFNQSRAATSAEVDDIKQKSAELCDFIDLVKCELLTATEENFCEANKLTKDYNPMKINAADNVEIPNLILFRKNNVGELSVLKEKITAFQKSILSSEKVNENIKNLTTSLLNTSDINENEQIISWEQREFLGNQLIIVLEVLSRIKSNARFLEAEISE
ncbi:MAG: hypothetical protein A2033_19695 [Bacteroidetes bacterium GWA2_31_9]|nr:MAG: hypothetical protein A2033_19695 [Bacteroidetes bacterium GWA2_31_9]